MYVCMHVKSEHLCICIYNMNEIMIYYVRTLHGFEYKIVYLSLCVWVLRPPASGNGKFNRIHLPFLFYFFHNFGVFEQIIKYKQGAVAASGFDF